jgi:hypothetical protein
MNHYYDPWGHTYRLVLNRIALFVLLSCLLSLGAWCLLLWHLFGWTTVMSLTAVWTVAQGQGELAWQLVFWLLAATCSLAVGLAFVALMRSGRLRRGDQHRRGTRVIDDHNKDA